VEELRQGTTEVELASIVCYAAALRIAQFHTRNEFSDWDAALHTFTFSNAVHQGLRRLPTMEQLRLTMTRTFPADTVGSGVLWFILTTSALLNGSHCLYDIV
jgi:hypothetical protein